MGAVGFPFNIQIAKILSNKMFIVGVQTELSNSNFHGTLEKIRVRQLFMLESLL